MQGVYLNRIILGCLLLLVGGAEGAVLLKQSGSATPFQHERWQQVLNDTVQQVGWVDFSMLKRQPTALNAYLDQLAAVAPNEKGRSNTAFPTPAHVLAYYLNAHNALMLRLTLDAYPTPLVVAIPQGAAYLQRRYRVGGEALLPAELRQKAMAFRFQYPEVEAGLASLDLDGPPLFPQAFRAETLEVQLAALAKQPLSPYQTLKKNPQSTCHVWLGAAGVSLPNLQKKTGWDGSVPLPRPLLNVAALASSKPLWQYCLAPSEETLPSKRLLMDAYQLKP